MEIGDPDRRELLRIFGMARAVLAAREFLTATAEIVGPDTPPDELLRHLTRYRAHLSALAVGGTAPPQAERGLAGWDASMSWLPAAGSVPPAGAASGQPTGRPMVRQDA